MDVLLEHLHASPDATVAFGDAKVDIPMLEHSRMGVAMGNGGPEIRARRPGDPGCGRLCDR